MTAAYDGWDDMAATVPQDVPAERAVLGAMILRPSVIPDVTATLAAGDYWTPQHAAVHDAIVALWQAKQPVDTVTVARELATREQLPPGQGPMFVHELTEACPMPHNAAAYAGQVLDPALRRRMLDAFTAGRQRVVQAEDATEAAEDARRLVDEAASHSRTTDSGTVVGESLDAALEWLENPPDGAPTPWPDVNDRTNGLLPGQMVTVAGRPGHGKSIIAKDVGLFTAMQGRPVHIATLEMSRNEYLARVLAGLAAVPLSNMLRRTMSDAEWQRVAEASGKVRDLPLVLDDREAQTMAQIRTAARTTARRHGDQLGLIAIDYAQLVRPAETRGVPREQQVAQISRDTKLMAKEFACPVLLLAQLNRGNVQRADPRPVVSDLRESGSLEQDSDQVWLLHRPDQYGDEERLGEVDLIVGKNRNGPAPTHVPLAFQGHYGRIVSMV